MKDNSEFGRPEGSGLHVYPGELRGIDYGSDWRGDEQPPEAALRLIKETPRKFQEQCPEDHQKPVFQGCAFGRIVSTGQGAVRTTRSATLPMNMWPRPLRP
jgi:hypothetical protein